MKTPKKELKLIIAGSRDHIIATHVVDYYISDLKIRNLIKEVVCGGAAGVDTSGEKWAKSEGVPVKYFNADWDTHGKAAGPIRNREMAKYANALLLLWDGESPGSKNMKKEAEKENLLFFEVILHKN